jgi:hypothetical protein
VNIEVPVTDIDDEGHGRLQSGDVCKVLFRSNAHVNASGFGNFKKAGNHILKVNLIGEEIVRTEENHRIPKPTMRVARIVRP